MRFSLRDDVYVVPNHPIFSPPETAILGSTCRFDFDPVATANAALWIFIYGVKMCVMFC